MDNATLSSKRETGDERMDRRKRKGCGGCHIKRTDKRFEVCMGVESRAPTPREVQEQELILVLE